MRIITKEELQRKYEAIRATCEHECEEARMSAYADRHSVPDTQALREIERAEARFQKAVAKLNSEFGVE